MNVKCGLVNIKNEDNGCFRWFHVRHPSYLSGEEIGHHNRDTYVDKAKAQSLDYSGINFPVFPVDPTIGTLSYLVDLLVALGLSFIYPQNHNYLK